MSQRNPDVPSAPEDAWYTDVWNVLLVIVFTLLLVLLLMWVFGIAILNAPPPPVE